MEEAKESLWARSFLFRLVCYSMAASVVITGAAAAERKVHHTIHPVPTEAYLNNLAWVACITFWVIFGSLAAILTAVKALEKKPVPPRDGSNDRRDA